MNSCVIVTFYPQTTQQEILLIDCLTSLKKFGKTIILVSHKEIKRDIQKLVDYFLFDKENELLKPEEIIKCHPQNYKSETVPLNGQELKIYSLNSTLVLPAVLKALNLATNFAKMLGFEYSHYVVGDIIFDESDFQHIADIENKVESENKLGYFEVVRNNHSYNGVETVYWFAKNDWFLDNFLNIYKKEDLLPIIGTEFYLERYFESRLMPFENRLVIHHKSHGENLVSFSKSSNLGRSLNLDFGNFIFTVIYLKSSDNFALLIHNSIPNCKVVECEIYYNASGQLGEWKPTAQPYTWTLMPVGNSETSELNIRVILKDGSVRRYDLDKECLDRIKNLSVFF